jgi:cyanosortase A-associated protein
MLGIAGCGAVALALYSLASPAAGRRALPAYHFPETVPLAGWEAIGTEPLRDAREDVARAPDVVLAGQRYRFRRDGAVLDAELRYVAGTLGDIAVLLRDQSGIPREVFRQRELQHDPAIGWWCLFTHESRTHLDACINPRGGTTVTDAQFRATHRAHDFTRRRLGLWLLGRESLRDYRCLWAHLSTPTTEGGEPAARARLEAAWADWHRPWQSQFPRYPHAIAPAALHHPRP